nr:MAG TPA: hypothetical protein [Caudoviricetes sp.]
MCVSCILICHNSLILPCNVTIVLVQTKVKLKKD